MAKQRKPLNPTQIKIIKAKSNGEKNIGAKVFPNQTPNSAAVSVSKELKKPNVQEALAEALEAHGITLDIAIEPISKALKAKRIVQSKMGNLFTTDLDDVDLQLKGSDRALKLMGIGNNSEGGTTNNFIFIAKEQRAKYDIS